MKKAYKCKSADKARKRLQALVSWLERNGYDEAAGSLREGMEETVPSINSSCMRLANFLQPECFGRLHVGRFESRRRLYSGVEV